MVMIRLTEMAFHFVSCDKALERRQKSYILKEERAIITSNVMVPNVEECRLRWLQPMSQTSSLAI